MCWQWLLALILILPLSRQVLCQSGDDGTAPPLGDVAKNSKDTPKSKAKRVFTDDNLNVRTNPIPAIALAGPDNIEEILNAIHDFKTKHTQAETENAVHEWFDEQSGVLSAAIDSNIRLARHNQIKMEAAQDSYAYGTRYDGDYSKLQQRQLSERWAQRADVRTSQENFAVIGRVQVALVRVRCDVLLNRTKTAYDWFRIPTANGAGTY